MLTPVCKQLSLAVQATVRATQAMRLFVGEPVWTPLNRPQEDHPSRKKYEESFAAGHKITQAVGNMSEA